MGSLESDIMYWGKSPSTILLHREKSRLKEVHDRRGLPFTLPMNYENKRWDNLRKTILRRDEYMCQECKRYGRLREGSHVHHIFPAETYEEYRYKTWNLITLCQACHNKMHDRDTHQLSKAGEELLERTRRLQNRISG